MYLAITLFAMGVMLVVLEVFIPSMGLLTLSAMACFGLSVWRAYVEVGAGAAWTMGIIAPILTVVVLYFGLTYIPRTALGRGLVLYSPADEGVQVPPTISETAALSPKGGTDEEESRRLIGTEGVAQSDLRPAGMVAIAGQRVDVVTEGGMIDAGARVKVVAVEGNRVVVRRVRV